MVTGYTVVHCTYVQYLLVVPGSTDIYYYYVQVGTQLLIDLLDIVWWGIHSAVS